MKNVNLFIDLSSSDTGITAEDVDNQELYVFSIKISDFKQVHDKNERALLKIKDLDCKLDKLLSDFDFNVGCLFLEAPFVNSRFLLSSEMVLKMHGFMLHKFQNLHFSFLTPTEIKKAVTGRGNANKEDVIAAVKELGYNLDIDGKENDNVYDSFAIYLAFYLLNHPDKDLEDLTDFKVIENRLNTKKNL